MLPTKSVRRIRLVAGLAALFWAASASAVPFTIAITNTGTNSAYSWSTGLLTLSPTIALGLTPQPGSPTYPTYVYANSNCNLSDAICSGSCSDNGNALVLAQRLGLTLGVNAWLVPPLPAGSNSTAITPIDVPVGSRLSYIAWVNNTSVFDDFVAMHPPGDRTTLSIPLFTASGTPLSNLTFQISGFDSNSTSPTDGSGATCSQECPTQPTGCYVAPGNASLGIYPSQPPTVSPVEMTASGTTTTTTPAASYTFSYRATSRLNAAQTLTYVLPAGVTFVSAPNGTYNASTRTVTWTNNGNLRVGDVITRTVNVNLGVFGGTTAHTGTLRWTVSNRQFVISASVTTVYTVTIAPSWVYTEPQLRATDGLAIANLTSSPGNELLVLAPTRGASGPGRAIVLGSSASAATELSSFSPGTGRNVMGLPLAEELSGGGTQEYVFGEPLPMSADAGVFARNGNSTGLWTSIPYGYSSYWMMGPSSANVLPGVAGNELVIADWDGHVNLLQGGTGAVQATYDTWLSDGDHAFGHVSLADLDLDGTLEVVIAGTTTGTVIALNADTMTLQWKSGALKTLYGDYPYGSGPAVGNLDGDARPEIVVATRGATSDIYVFDVSQPSGAVCEHRFDPGGSFTYTSPVIGDVDGSGVKSIVTISSTDSVLSVMKASTPGCATAGGRIVWQHTIKAGDYASFTPALYDVNGDGTLDVIAASAHRVQLIDVRNRRVLMTFDDAATTTLFWPSAVVGDADPASAVREIYVPGNRNSKLYRLTLPAAATSTNDWTTFMGNNARTGAR